MRQCGHCTCVLPNDCELPVCDVCDHKYKNIYGVKIMTDDDLYEPELFILRATQSAGESGVTEDDLVIMYKWYEKVSVERSLVDMVLEGKVDIFVDNGEVSLRMRT